MKAVELHGKRDLRVREIPEEPLDPGEVRVRIEAALTCGTDVKVWRRGYHARMLSPPCRFGHEFAGVITEAHPGAMGWSVGERVTAANSAPCGDCDYCRRGQEELCRDLLFLNGAYAESIVIPARLAQKNLLRLGPKTAFRDAALVEPLACVVHGLDRLQVQSGERVLIIGSGPIGLMATALARAAGAEVIVAGRGRARLATASHLGASAVVEASGHEDVEWSVKSALETTEFDAVFEAVGKPETWAAAVRLVRPGGRVNWFGGCPSGSLVTLDTAWVHYSALTLMSSFHHTPRAIRRALEWIESGTIRAADFVTAEAGLSELPDVFARIAAGNAPVKTAIDPRR